MKVNEIRSARITSYLKVNMDKKKELELNKIIPLDVSDPYKDVDDDDQDKLYKPSPKKRKIDTVSDKK